MILNNVKRLSVVIAMAAALPISAMAVEPPEPQPSVQMQILGATTSVGETANLLGKKLMDDEEKIAWLTKRRDLLDASNEAAKVREDVMIKERSVLKAANEELKAQVVTLTAERDALKAAKDATSPPP